MGGIEASRSGKSGHVPPLQSGVFSDSHAALGVGFQATQWEQKGFFLPK